LTSAITRAPVLAPGLFAVPSTTAGFFAVTNRRRIAAVAMGTVKWFNPTKGYGFIKPDAGGTDVFVHISAVEKAGYTSLAEGARISYELVSGRSGKSSGENLRVG
jgi:cold shock protein